MSGNCRCRRAVNEGFQELALALGGVASSYELPDEAVWDLARAMDLTHERIQARLMKSEFIAQLDDTPESGCGHAAVQHLLGRLDHSPAARGGDHRE